PKPATGPGQARHDCSNRNSQGVRDLLVAISFDVQKEQNLTMFGGELGHRAGEIASQLPIVRRGRCREAVRENLDLQRLPAPRIGTQPHEKEIVENREQPAGRVRSCVRPVDAARMAAGPNALRGSGPNPKHAFGDALTQAGSPDPRNDRVCITSLCPRQFPMTLHAANSYAAGNNFGSLNRSPRTIMAQAMRAILLASATAATLIGRRSIDPRSETTARRKCLPISHLGHQRGGDDRANTGDFL